MAPRAQEEDVVAVVRLARRRQVLPEQAGDDEEARDAVRAAADAGVPLGGVEAGVVVVVARAEVQPDRSPASSGSADARPRRTRASQVLSRMCSMGRPSLSTICRCPTFLKFWYDGQERTWSTARGAFLEAERNFGVLSSSSEHQAAIEGDRRPASERRRSSRAASRPASASFAA